MTRIAMYHHQTNKNLDEMSAEVAETEQSSFELDYCGELDFRKYLCSHNDELVSDEEGLPK